ncbi:MAG: hypothetical protein IPM54_24980 [Polyangiaceae bacterium]|nr:hypothetical protein [Polyangiaceae bacterium]
MSANPAPRVRVVVKRQTATYRRSQIGFANVSVVEIDVSAWNGARCGECGIVTGSSTLARAKCAWCESERQRIAAGNKMQAERALAKLRGEAFEWLFYPEAVG